MESRVKIAIQKNGRLSTESLSILKKCGIEFSDSNNKLFIKSTNMLIDLLMVRDDDIPRLVSQNIADLGIVGENLVSEKQLSDSSLKSKTILKLGFSKCRLSFAKPKKMKRKRKGLIYQLLEMLLMMLHQKAWCYLKIQTIYCH